MGFLYATTLALDDIFVISLIFGFLAAMIAITLGLIASGILYSLYETKDGVEEELATLPKRS